MSPLQAQAQDMSSLCADLICRAKWSSSWSRRRSESRSAPDFLEPKRVYGLGAALILQHAHRGDASFQVNHVAPARVDCKEPRDLSGSQREFVPSEDVGELSEHLPGRHRRVIAQDQPEESARLAVAYYRRDKDVRVDDDKSHFAPLALFSFLYAWISRSISCSLPAFPLRFPLSISAKKSSSSSPAVGTFSFVTTSLSPFRYIASFVFGLMASLRLNSWGMTN